VLNGADDAVRALVAGGDEAAAARGAHADPVAGATIVDAPITLGFADGANLGVESAAGELVLLFHHDAEPHPGWLEPLVELLDTRPEAGAAGGLMLLPDGTPKTAGALLWNDGTTSPSWGAGEPRLPEGPIAVDYAASASLLVRRAAWQLAGGADPELHPAYYVDVDLALRLRRLRDLLRARASCTTRARARAAGRASWRPSATASASSHAGARSSRARRGRATPPRGSGPRRNARGQRPRPPHPRRPRQPRGRPQPSGCWPAPAGRSRSAPPSTPTWRRSWRRSRSA
jgi:hypothetical protein